MRQAIRFRALVQVITLWLCASSALSNDGWFSSPTAMPIDFGSLRLNAADAEAPQGRFAVSVMSTYFNAWRSTWHPPTFHSNLHLQGKSLTQVEIDRIEHDFPNDDVYHIDLEGMRHDVAISMRSNKLIVGTLRVAFIEVGTPRWDAIADGYHRNFMGSHYGSRTLFPRSGDVVFIRSPSRHVAVHRLDGLTGNHLGDASITLGIPIGRHAAFDQRLAFAIKAPTGKADSLFGSGGWDAAIGWNAVRIGTARRLLVAGSCSRLGPAGTVMGIKRAAYILDASAEVQQEITRSTAVRFSAQLDASPLRGRTRTNLGNAALLFYTGAVHALPHHRWVAFDIGEGYPAIGVAHDWTFHLSFGRTWL